MAAETLVNGVLQQAVHQDDVAAGEFVAARHLLLDAQWWQTNLRSRSCIRLHALHAQEVAKTLPEGEICHLHGVLQQRAVDLVSDCIEEGGVALELCEPERRPQPPHHGVHHVGDDVLCMLELDAGKKAGVAGDIRDHETT